MESKLKKYKVLKDLTTYFNFNGKKLEINLNEGDIYKGFDDSERTKGLLEKGLLKEIK